MLGRHRGQGGGGGGGRGGGVWACPTPEDAAAGAGGAAAAGAGGAAGAVAGPALGGGGPASYSAIPRRDGRLPTVRPFEMKGIQHGGNRQGIQAQGVSNLIADGCAEACWRAAQRQWRRAGARRGRQ